MDGKEILIVEDDQDIQEIYRNMLTDAFDVRIVQQYNGKEGIDAVEKHHPDLIILDLLMPVMDGEEFLRVLKEERKIKNIPVVVCSVNHDLAQELLRDKKIDAMLPKLFPPKRLADLVQRFLQLSPKK